MKRRLFLSRTVKALMVAPFIVTQKAKSLVGIIVAIIFATVMGLIFYKLCQLCNKKLKRTTPPDNSGSSSIRPNPMADTSGAQLINIKFEPEWFWLIDQSQDQIFDPYANLYKWFVQISLEWSQDFKTWTPAGRLTFYANDTTLLIQDHDQDGALMASDAITGWTKKTIPCFQRAYPQSDQLFYRCTSLIKE